MKAQKRKRITKAEAEVLCKQIKDLISLEHKISAIAKTLNKSRQTIEYYARYRKLSTTNQ